MLEVVSAASQEVEIKLESHEFGGCAIDSTGQPLPDSTLKACREADAILMGASAIYFAIMFDELTRHSRLDWWS